MTYIKAKDVSSPQASWKLVRVLRDPGPSNDIGRVSWAAGFWEGRPVIVSRWNGSDDAPLGMPQSRGLSIWFVQDDESEGGYDWLLAHLDAIAPEHRDWLRGFLALREAA